MANFFRRSSTASLSFEHTDAKIDAAHLEELFTDLKPDDQTDTVRINLNELPDPPMNILIAVGQFAADHSENVSIETKVHPQTAQQMNKINLGWFEYQEAENG